MTDNNDRRPRPGRASSARTSSRASRAARSRNDADRRGAGNLPGESRARSEARARSEGRAREEGRVRQEGGVRQGRRSIRNTKAGRQAQMRASRLTEREERRMAEIEQQAQLEAAAFELSVEPKGLKATAGGRYQQRGEGGEPQFVSTSVGELRRAERNERLKRSSRRYLMRIIIAVGVVVVLLAGWAALYNSPAFTIENVKVNGVEHLTDDEISQLMNVPAGTTLLRVDTESIRNRLMQTAWIEDVEVKRAFPSTLEINVTERAVKAVVEIPISSGIAVKSWAIAEDHMWLMPIPDADSEAAKTTSAQIYADAESVLHIVDVPYGTKAEIGEICSDGNVNNALDIISGMTTELAGQVVKVSAAGPAETTLILENGVEVAFGKAENIRDKERVILKILEENPDGVAYINVRMVETPTWRAV